ncbi:DUF3299 domain-containing protein [Paraferrimonas sedimenticola]|uniref:DUF3299 domain-containing protein n=1 Tax=Paraferrimonas sedimenticola TaxID=375674 RepID=A0AA37W0Y3_9GAMM|nr:DUF3299 domain-containing protein [Paraferrimonas sedimenticola]GLP96298.1 hypothetical protein GCM10007895_16040 [Paraferrimonas sedimenticola]
MKWLATLLLAFSATCSATTTLQWLDLAPKEAHQDIIFYSGKVSNAHRMGGNHETQYDQVRHMRNNPQMSKVIDALDGKQVRLAGYIVPLNIDGDVIDEILLAPYPGACLIAPPPPENQLVYVKLKQPIPMSQLFEPIWIEGVISTEHSDTDAAASGYSMMQANWQLYAKG